jgi:hypothetical protein
MGSAFPGWFFRPGKQHRAGLRDRWLGFLLVAARRQIDDE